MYTVGKDNEHGPKLQVCSADSGAGGQSQFHGSAHTLSHQIQERGGYQGCRPIQALSNSHSKVSCMTMRMTSPLNVLIKVSKGREEEDAGIQKSTEARRMAKVCRDNTDSL